MKTQIFYLTSKEPAFSESTSDSLKTAANILKKGGLVAFPTETVYGLGGSATDAEAAKKIYAAKGRPSDNPLIIHIAAPEDAEAYAHTTPLYYRLAKTFMPGPLTMILPKKDTIPETVTGGLKTVAIRCPSDPIAHELIRLSGVPIAAPSANLSGSPSPTCGEHVIADLDGRVDAILVGNVCEIGLESTIVKLDGEKVTLLRPGAVTVDALRCVCENVEIAPAVTETLKENERPLSPGMKYKHYAPSVPFILLDGDEDLVLSYLRRAQNKEKCAILCYHEELEHLRYERLIDIGERDDLPAQAHALFDALRCADKLDCDIIYGHLPPRDGLGLALYNRMIRAAAHTVRHI